MILSLQYFTWIWQVAGRTNDSAGDGTTTAAILAREMIKYGLQVVTAGANPINVKKGIDKTVEYLTGKLEESAKPVEGREDIKVGTVVNFVVMHMQCKNAASALVQSRASDFTSK